MSSILVKDSRSAVIKANQCIPIKISALGFVAATFGLG
jgi:hypothetical protein